MAKNNSSRKQRVFGHITKNVKKGSYTIFMYEDAQSIELNGSVRIRPYSVIDLLCTLAHELAHIKHWLHTPHHKMLENHITTLFMQKLEKDGYISEEKDKCWSRTC